MIRIAYPTALLATIAAAALLSGCSDGGDGGGSGNGGDGGIAGANDQPIPTPPSLADMRGLYGTLALRYQTRQASSAPPISESAVLLEVNRRVDGSLAAPLTGNPARRIECWPFSGSAAFTRQYLCGIGSSVGTAEDWFAFDVEAGEIREGRYIYCTGSVRECQAEFAASPADGPLTGTVRGL